MEKKQRRLTPKRERFCEEFIKNGGNATQAYKTAFDCKNWKGKSINEKACTLVKDVNIKSRIAELKKPFQDEFKYSVKESFEQFLKIQEMALENVDLTNAIKCEENKAKLLGLFIDKKLIDVNAKTFKDFLREVK